MVSTIDVNPKVGDFFAVGCLSPLRCLGWTCIPSRGSSYSHGLSFAKGGRCYSPNK